MRRPKRIDVDPGTSVPNRAPKNHDELRERRDVIWSRGFDDARFEHHPPCRPPVFIGEGCASCAKVRYQILHGFRGMPAFVPGEGVVDTGSPE